MRKKTQPETALKLRTQAHRPTHPPRSPPFIVLSVNPEAEQYKLTCASTYLSPAPRSQKLLILKMAQVLPRSGGNWPYPGSSSSRTNNTTGQDRLGTIEQNVRRLNHNDRRHTEQNSTILSQQATMQAEYATIQAGQATILSQQATILSQQETMQVEQATILSQQAAMQAEQVSGRSRQYDHSLRMDDLQSQVTNNRETLQQHNIRFGTVDLLHNSGLEAVRNEFRNELRIFQIPARRRPAVEPAPPAKPYCFRDVYRVALQSVAPDFSTFDPAIHVDLHSLTREDLRAWMTDPATYHSEEMVRLVCDEQWLRATDRRRIQKAFQCVIEIWKNDYPGELGKLVDPIRRHVIDRAHGFPILKRHCYFNKKGVNKSVTNKARWATPPLLRNP